MSQLLGMLDEPVAKPDTAQTESQSLPSRRDVHRAAPRGSTLGVIALILGLAAMVVSLVQPLAIVALLPAVVAIVLGIVAIARRGARKAFATAGLVVAALAVPIGAFSYSAGLQAGVKHDDPAALISSGPSETPSPSATPSASPSASPSSAPVVAPAPAPVRDARIGGTAKDLRGVAFTLNAVNCGLSTAGSAEDAPTGGSYCEVRFSAVNRGGASVTLTSSDVSMTWGDAAFWAVASDFGGASSAELGPGASTQGSFYVEVTGGVRPDHLVLGAGAAFTL